MSLSRMAYKPGDVIQGNCKPLFKVISVVTEKGKLCDGCFKPGRPLKHCAVCSHMHYCSRKCQTDDWKNGHKLECTSKAWNNNFNDQTSVEFRCQLFRGLAYLHLNSDAMKKPFKIYNGEFRSLNDLLSFSSPEAEASFSNPILEPICVELAAEIKDENLDTGEIVADTTFLVKIARILQLNAFVIYNEDQTTVLGSGIYAEPSIFKHDCKPTAMFYPKGVNMEVKAIAFIPEGEKPTISYFATHCGKQERQEKLKQLFNFDCLCERCVTNADAAVDFEQLDANTLFFHLCRNDADVAANYTIGHYLKRHEETIKWMRTMYNEYDERMSNQYARTVLALLNGHKRQDKKRFAKMKNSREFRAFIQEARKHLKISFGEDQFNYQVVNRALKAAGFGV